MATVQAILLIGESNSGGYAPNTDLSAAELAPRPSLQILNNNTLDFEDLDIPSNQLIGHDMLGTPDTHGFEVGFANDADAGLWGSTPIYLLKCGQGGSKFEQWEDADAYWTTFTTRFAAAQDQFDTLGLTPKWSILISIGINDILAGMTAATYKTELSNYISRIRAVVGDVPVGLTLFMSDFASWNTKQTELASELPRVFTLPMTDYPLRTGDTLHWGAAAFKLGATDYVNGLEALGYLPMSNVVFSDAFTGTAGTELTSHTPEIGTGWAKNGNYPSSSVVLNGTGQARGNLADFSIYHIQDAASQPNQRLTATIKFATANAVFLVLRQRCLTTNFGGYELYYDGSGWLLRTGYDFTSLDTLTDSISNGQSRTIIWDVTNGTSSVDHVVTVVGVGELTASDTAAGRVTTAGRAGFWRNALDTNTTGQQLDFFELSEIVASSGGVGFGIGTGIIGG